MQEGRNSSINTRVIPVIRTLQRHTPSNEENKHLYTLTHEHRAELNQAEISVRLSPKKETSQYCQSQKIKHFVRIYVYSGLRFYRRQKRVNTGSPNFTFTYFILVHNYLRIHYQCNTSKVNYIYYRCHSSDILQELFYCFIILSTEQRIINKTEC